MTTKKKKIPFADEELLRMHPWHRLQQYFAIIVVHKTWLSQDSESQEYLINFLKNNVIDLISFGSYGGT